MSIFLHHHDPLGSGSAAVTKPRQHRDLFDRLCAGAGFEKPTEISWMSVRPSGSPDLQIPVYTNEYWSSKQRDAAALHEFSYRACFKASLPRFFIKALTKPGDRVHDPFGGRGTTALEAALLGRVPLTCDINPVSRAVFEPRLFPPTLREVDVRLKQINFNQDVECPEELMAFYHPDTLRQICSLRNHLMEREKAGALDYVDRWIRMIAISRLTGHSPGFFSVYTLPPNQAVSVRRQRKINEQRNQVPPLRDVPGLIIKKSHALLVGCTGETTAGLAAVREGAMILCQSAVATPEIPSNSVDLVVSSPPFLDVVDYAADNWLRCWFLGVDSATVPFTMTRDIVEWQRVMTKVFVELHRVVLPGAHIVFEVGEVHGGKVKLEEVLIPCGVAAGLDPLLVMINEQEFTKTANCWGIANNKKGTNSNRLVVFQKGVVLHE